MSMYMFLLGQVSGPLGPSSDLRSIILINLVPVNYIVRFSNSVYGIAIEVVGSGV